MARFNTALTSTSISGTATIGSPGAGAFTNLTGTAPYTVTVPNPTLFPGVNQVFYNATSGTITLTTPSGNFNGTGGNGTASMSIFAGNVVSITSDGTHYIVISEDGSALTATTGAFSGNVTMNGSGATVSITPSTLTVTPSGASTIDNVAIGGTTRAAGAFTSLAANAAVTFTANTASSSTGTGTLVVTGGVGVSGQVTATAVSATNLTGTLQTAAQTNITSLGTLTGLTVSGSAFPITTLTSSYTTGNKTYSSAILGSATTNTGAQFGFVRDTITATNSFAHITPYGLGEGSALAVGSTGNVGIGTTSPSAPLHVIGSDARFGSGQYPVLTIYPTVNSAIFGLRLDGAVSSNGRDWRLEQGRSANGQLNITDITAGNLIRLMIDANGSVGIGITANYTGAKLFVDNSIHTNYNGEIAMRYNVSGSTTSYWKGMSGTSPASGGSARGLHFFNYDADSDEGINFWTGRPGSATQLIKIIPSGNVGIGTTNPQAKLHINAGSGAISIRDYKSIVYNLDASILEGQTYQRFSIGINTSVTNYPRTSGYVRVTVVPNPDGGIGLVYSSVAEFSIWRIDGNNNANFKTISVANGTIGIATPVASGNTVIFGFTMPNNGTGTTPSFTIKIEVIAADVGNYVITPITANTVHTGANLSGVSMLTNATSAYFGGTPYASIASGSQLYTSANAASNPNGNEANAVTGWAAGYAGQVPTSVGTDNGIVPYAGSYQLKFTGSSNGFRSDYAFQATAGRRYSVSFWGNQYQGQYYYIGYIATTAGSGDNYGTWVNPEGAVALNNVGWTQYQFVFTATVSQLYYLSIRMATNSSPAVIFYLDNISITELQGSNLYANGLTAGGTSLLSTVTTGLLSVSPPAPMAANVGPTLGNGGIRVFGQNPTITLEGDSNSYYPFFINKGVNGQMNLGTYYSGGWYDSSGSQHSFTLNGGSPALTLTGNGLQIDNQKTGNIYGIHQVHSRTKTYNVASGTWLPVVFVNHTCSCNVNIQVYHPSGVNNGSYMWSGVIGGGYGSVTTTQIQTQGLGTSYITSINARYNNAGYNLEVLVNGTFGGTSPIVYVSVSGLSYGTLTAA